MKFEYIMFEDDGKVGAAIHVEDGWIPIFKIKADGKMLNRTVNKMIEIFEENSSQNERGELFGPGFVELDWGEDIVEKYEEYAKSE